jgi:hypothetical protein
MNKKKSTLNIKPITTQLEDVHVINKCDTCKANIYTNNYNFFDNKILCHDCSVCITYFRCPLCMDLHTKTETVKFDIQKIKTPSKLTRVSPAISILSPKFINTNVKEELMICKKCDVVKKSKCCWFF